MKIERGGAGDTIVPEVEMKTNSITISDGSLSVVIEAFQTKAAVHCAGIVQNMVEGMD